MPGLNLYQLAHGAERVAEMLESGELDESALRAASEIATEILEHLLPEKVRDYCALMRQLRLMAQAFKAEEERIARRREAFESLEARLRDRLKGALEVAKVEKLEAGTFTVRLQRAAPSVVVEDELVIPEDYFVITRRVDKRLLASALKAGAPIEGARLQEKLALVIR